MSMLDIFFEGQLLLLCFLVLIQLKVNDYVNNDSSYANLRHAVPVLMGNLVCEILAAYFDGNTSGIGWFMVRFGNFGYSCSYIIMAYIMLDYIISYFSERGLEVKGRWFYLAEVSLVISGLGLIQNLFTGTYYSFNAENIYHRGRYHLVGMILPAISIVILWLVIVYYRKGLGKKDFTVLILFFAGPFAGAILQVFFLGHPYIIYGIACSTLLVLGITEKTSRTKRIEKEIIYDQNRSYLLNSQIKSHFLFNSLSVIQSLIWEEPEEAKSAIGHLARYLRMGLDIKKSEKPVSIKDEMDYVRSYMYMQELRFSNKLKTIYEIDESLDFEIPFLSIQPLAENAVRHGIREKDTEGHVYIRIFSEKKDYVIEVKDDGVGFDVNVPLRQRKRLQKDSGAGIGLENLKERLADTGKCRIEITSTPGIGTKACIRVAK